MELQDLRQSLKKLLATQLHVISYITRESQNMCCYGWKEKQLPRHGLVANPIQIPALQAKILLFRLYHEQAPQKDGIVLCIIIDVTGAVR